MPKPSQGFTAGSPGSFRCTTGRHLATGDTTSSRRSSRSTAEVSGRPSTGGVPSIARCRGERGTALPQGPGERARSLLPTKKSARRPSGSSRGSSTSSSSPRKRAGGPLLRRSPLHGPMPQGGRVGPADPAWIPSLRDAGTVQEHREIIAARAATICSIPCGGERLRLPT